MQKKLIIVPSYTNKYSPRDPRIGL